MTHFLSCVPRQFPLNLLGIYRPSSCRWGPSGVENSHLKRPSKIIQLLRFLIILFKSHKNPPGNQINNNQKKKSLRIIHVSYLLCWFLAEDVETMPQSELTYQTWGPWSNSWWVVGAGGILHIKQNDHQTFTCNTKYMYNWMDSVVSLHKQIKTTIYPNFL